MTLLLSAAAFALLLWWLGTGLVLWLDGLQRRTFAWSLAAASALALLGLYAIGWSQEHDGTLAVYAAFAGALAVWAWQELSYYLGFITGPRKHACAPGCSGGRHFVHALQTSLHHEVSILVGALLVWQVEGDAPLPVALWTYALLWWMHESARINVFLGVRNVNAEWLPEHLQYLRSFLREAPMNPFFPFSVGISVLGAWWIFTQAAAQTDPAAASAYFLLGALACLAIIEHVFLMLPIPLTAPWRWALGSRRREATGHRVPVRNGAAQLGP